MADQNEQAIAEIIEAGRQTRGGTPRWIWVLALVSGAVCLIAFVVAVTRTAPPTEPRTPGQGSIPPAPATATTVGFGAGLGLGVAIGITIGFAVARQRRAHSSRRRP